VLLTRAGISFPVTFINKELTEQYGGGLLDVVLTLNDSVLTADQGFRVVRSKVIVTGGGALWLKETAKLPDTDDWPTLFDEPYDEEMQIHTPQERQVVPAAYVVDTGSNFVETKRGIDEWRSLRTKLTKLPTAVDEASAIVSELFAPFQFPGTLNAFQSFNSNAWFGYRSVRAEFVSQIVKIWWVNSPTKPVIAFDEIVTDSIVIASGGRIERFHGVLHDAWTSTIGFTTDSYPETIPSFSEYYLGTPDGTFTDHNFIVAYNPGVDYGIGDVLTIPADSGPSAQIEVTNLGVSNSITGYNIIDEGVGGVFTNPVSVTGGLGTGAAYNVLPYSVPNYIPGTAWVGTPRVVAANVTPTDIPNLWKIQTRTIVMR
jgi:hypothetical protein